MSPLLAWLPCLLVIGCAPKPSTPPAAEVSVHAAPRPTAAADARASESEDGSACHGDPASFSRALVAALDSGSLAAWDALQAEEFRGWTRAEDRASRFEAWRRDLIRERREALRVGPHHVEEGPQPFLVVGASADDPVVVIHVIREGDCLRINDQ